MRNDPHAASFGRFLRDAGLVQDADITRAVDFQRRTTPSFETLVRAYGLLDDHQILELLAESRTAERSFDDLATERGLLSADDAELLRRRAKDYHLPLGETLVLLGLIDRPTMEAKLRDYWRTAARTTTTPEPAARPIDRLESLRELFRAVGGARKRADTLERILDAAVRCVPCDCAFVATVDRERQIKVERLFETRDRLPSLEDVTTKVLDLEQNHTRGIYRHVAATGETYRTGDVEAQSERYYIPGWEGVRSNLTVPITNPDGTVVGVLALESVDADAFDEQDQRYLETLAAYAAMAMRGVEQSERRAKEGRVLWNFGHCMRAASKGVATTEGTRAVLEQVLALCLEESGAHQGYIALREPASDTLDVAILKGDRALPKGRRPTAFKFGEGITGTVARTGEPIVTGNVGDRDEFIEVFEGMRSELAVPLVYHREVIGVLNLESRKTDAFSDDDLDYCRRLADTFAPLVHAAQFFEYTEKVFGRGIQLVGNSLAMARLRHTLLPAARSEATILLTGESGTGKEFVSKQIHFNSRRREGPFEVISCTNTQAELIESELFGHKAGSFTGAAGDKIGLFELADGGTIFLDEIGDLQFDLQGKLLRVLQEGTIRRIGDTETRRVDVRVVAATHRDLKAMVEAGTFRPDLYYRLDQVSIEIPPLRERREDIVLLTDHFVRKYGEIEERRIEEITEDAVGHLWRRDWPGNVRELEYFVYKLVIFTEGERITGEDVERVAEQFDITLSPKIPTKLESTRLRHEIEMALNATRTDDRLFKARATRYLGWDKNTLASKMKALDIPG